MTVRPSRSWAAIALYVMQILFLSDAAGARKAPAPEAAIADVHCGICHSQMGVEALPAKRGGLDADYIRYVVRNGIGSMPPQTRVDLSDADLDAIATYLVRQGPR